MRDGPHMAQTYVTSLIVQHFPTCSLPLLSQTLLSGAPEGSDCTHVTNPKLGIGEMVY